MNPTHPIRDPDREKASRPFDCSLEPIQWQGFIQPHGALLLIDPAQDWTVVAVSANAEALLAGTISSQRLMGRRLQDIFGEAFGRDIFERHDREAMKGETAWNSVLPATDGMMELNLNAYMHAGLLYLEIEREHKDDRSNAATHVAQLYGSTNAMRETDLSPNALLRELAVGLRRLTDYERVVIYRFKANWDGMVVAQDNANQWPQSLDGLHFPASDIPIQARRLYLQSRLRWVADIDALPVPLDCDPNWQCNPFGLNRVDLSFSSLRCLSPIHLGFHRNVGINGSMSLSIVNDDQLWGLAVFHHRKPHRISPVQRMSSLGLVEAFSLRLSLAERKAEEGLRILGLAQLSKLLAFMSDAGDVPAALTEGPVKVSDLFSSSCAVILWGETVSVLGGSQLPAPELTELTAFLRSQSPGEEMIQLTDLPVILPGWQKHAVWASGVLALFLSTDRSDMVLWLRPGLSEDVKWAGNPQKQSATRDEPGVRVSFAHWTETVSAMAAPWRDWELDFARTLKSAIKDVAVRGQRSALRAAVIEQARKDIEDELVRTNNALAAQKLAAHDKAQSEAKLSFAIQAGQFGMWELDLSTTTLTTSNDCKAQFGFAPEAGFTFADFINAVTNDDRERIASGLESFLHHGLVFETECRILHVDGSTRWIQLRAQVTAAPDGTNRHLAGVSLDVTERVRSEERTRQSQRIEAVGRLTAGVAHDFNNVLQVLLGGIELAVSDLVDQPEVQAELALALEAGRRGARLTSHLLSFSRKQSLSPTSVEIQGLLEDLTHTLSRSLGNGIKVNLNIEPNIPRVLVDAAHLDSALLNLALNARDAMDLNGHLWLEAHHEAGQVIIAVTDTGIGMTPEVLAHACEPFFSTKGVKGSGLGLSMVHGFASQSGGELRISSSVKRGTRVEIWLPITSAASTTPLPVQLSVLSGQRGKVLLVDDDQDVTWVTNAVLRKAGFEVFVANSGNDALVRLSVNGPFDALVTDYAMLGMSGVDLILQARESSPNLSALIITGYAGAEGLDRLPSSVGIIRKPFRRDELVQRIEILLSEASMVK